MKFYFLLFDNFESLDLFGPVEIFGRIPGAELHYVSLEGGIVTSGQAARIETEKAKLLPPDGVLLIPGGMGTRALVKDQAFLAKLKELADSAAYVLTVCTGSALLAAAEMLGASGRPPISLPLTGSGARGRPNGSERPAG